MIKKVSEARRNVSSLVQSDQKLGLRFKDRDIFGDFAAQLTNDQVQYGLSGFQTLVLTMGQVATMPQHLRAKIQELLAGNALDVFQVPSRGKRVLNSPEETRELLRRFTKEL